MRRRRRCRRPRRRPRATSRRCRSIYASGQRLAPASNGGFTEYFKLDGNKKLRDTQYALAGRHSLARGEPRAGMTAAGTAGRSSAERGSSSGRNMRRHRAGGRLPPSNRVPRNLRELFGFERPTRTQIGHCVLGI